MRRPFAYVTAAWGEDQEENIKNAVGYCRELYELGYTPLCPALSLSLFLSDESYQERRDKREMARAFLCRSQMLVICGEEISETVLRDMAAARRMWITVMTLKGVRSVKERRREHS